MPKVVESEYLKNQLNLESNKSNRINRLNDVFDDKRINKFLGRVHTYTQGKTVSYIKHLAGGPWAAGRRKKLNLTHNEYIHLKNRLYALWDVTTEYEFCGIYTKYLCQQGNVPQLTYKQFIKTIDNLIEKYSDIENIKSIPVNNNGDSNEKLAIKLKEIAQFILLTLED